MRSGMRVLLSFGSLFVMAVARAQSVFACLDGSTSAGASSLAASQTCATVSVVAPVMLGTGALVSVCRGGTAVAGNTALDCVNDAGQLLWSQVGALGSGDTIIGSDSSYTLLTPEAVAFGTTVSSSNGSFDVNSLDPASLTAYFSWGWFIVALGWVTGKGVSIFVQFVKRL